MNKKMNLVEKFKEDLLNGKFKRINNRDLNDESFDIATEKNKKNYFFFYKDILILTPRGYSKHIEPYKQLAKEDDIIAEKRNGVLWVKPRQFSDEFRNRGFDKDGFLTESYYNFCIRWDVNLTNIMSEEVGNYQRRGVFPGKSRKEISLLFNDFYKQRYNNPLSVDYMEYKKKRGNRWYLFGDEGVVDNKVVQLKKNRFFKEKFKFKKRNKNKGFSMGNQMHIKTDKNLKKKYKRGKKKNISKWEKFFRLVGRRADKVSESGVKRILKRDGTIVNRFNLNSYFKTYRDFLFIIILKSRKNLRRFFFKYGIFNWRRKFFKFFFFFRVKQIFFNLFCFNFWLRPVDRKKGIFRFIYFKYVFFFFRAKFKKFSGHKRVRNLMGKKAKMALHKKLGFLTYIKRHEYSWSRLFIRIPRFGRRYFHKKSFNRKNRKFLPFEMNFRNFLTYIRQLSFLRLSLGRGLSHFDIGYNFFFNFYSVGDPSSFFIANSIKRELENKKYLHKFMKYIALELNNRVKSKSSAITGFKIVVIGRWARGTRSKFFLRQTRGVSISDVNSFVDFYSTQAVLKYGACGVRVWLYFKNLNLSSPSRRLIFG